MSRGQWSTAYGRIFARFELPELELYDTRSVQLFRNPFENFFVALFALFCDTFSHVWCRSLNLKNPCEINFQKILECFKVPLVSGVTLRALRERQHRTNERCRPKEGDVQRKVACLCCRQTSFYVQTCMGSAPWGQDSSNKPRICPKEHSQGIERFPALPSARRGPIGSAFRCSHSATMTTPPGHTRMVLIRVTLHRFYGIFHLMGLPSIELRIE